MPNLIACGGYWYRITTSGTWYRFLRERMWTRETDTRILAKLNQGLTTAVIS